MDVECDEFEFVVDANLDLQVMVTVTISIDVVNAKFGEDADFVEAFELCLDLDYIETISFQLRTKAMSKGRKKERDGKKEEFDFKNIDKNVKFCVFT